MKRHRAGNILILTLILMIPMLAMLAFSVDVGYMNVAKTELQRTADASALAGAWQLIDPNAVYGTTNPSSMLTKIRTVAANYSTSNKVMHESPALDSSDVQIGYYSNPLDPSAAFTTNATGPFNAVRVTTHRDEVRNGSIPLFFARAIGIDQGSFEAHATAVILSNIKGLRHPILGET